MKVESIINTCKSNTYSDADRDHWYGDYNDIYQSYTDFNTGYVDYYSESV